jgi:hypothetical protein
VAGALLARNLLFRRHTALRRNGWRSQEMMDSERFSVSEVLYIILAGMFTAIKIMFLAFYYVLITLILFTKPKY